MCLDIFGFNIMVMVAYSFTNSALKIYYLVPIYAVYKIWVTVRPMLEMFCPSLFGRGAKYDEHDT